MILSRQDQSSVGVKRKSTEQTAWQIGVDRYLSTLSPEQKNSFRAPASADDCLRLLQQAQARNRKFDKLITILVPLIEPLKRFEASIDVLVQTYSSIVSPIWGPIRMLVTIASNRLSSLQNVLLLLERLVEPLKRFHNYELLFRENIALRHAIGALYCDLIEFSTRVIAHQFKSPFHKSFGSFDRDVAEVSEKIRHHWAEVDTAANAANLLEAKAARIKEDLQRAYDFQRDVNRWLSPATVEDDLNRLLAACAEGSCDWVHESDEFETLITQNISSSIRICGHPGGGKSVTAASLVKHLQQTTKAPVLYSFCRATDSERSYTTSIVRTLVWQLLQLDQSLYNDVAEIYNRSGRRVADSEVLVFELFEAVLRNTTHSEIYLLIDALDECHDVTTLINLLSSVKSIPKLALKVIISSRDDPGLVEQLSFCNTHIALQTNPRPLIGYINSRIQSFQLPISEAEREDIGNVVISGSNGLWLFAKLMLDELEKAASVGEMHQQVKTVPDGLAQLYTTLLKNKEKQFTKIQLKMAQQIYLWLNSFDYIPEHLWKVRNTRGLDDQVIDVALKYAQNSESEIFSPMELVLRLCAPLITTRLLHEDHLILLINGQPLYCSAFFAEFFHHTAEQYLKWCLDADPIELPISIRPRRLAELHRGVCASWYFGQSEHFQLTLQHLQERPRSEYGDCWLEMACGFWQSLRYDQTGRGLSSAEILEAQNLCDKLTSFLKSENCLGFVEASIILHYSGQSTLLSENVNSSPPSYEASFISTSERSGSLQAFIESRSTFKADLGWILKRFSTTSTLIDDHDLDGLKPEGFERRPLARKMFTLARRYRWLALAPGACSINGFLMGSRG